MPYIGTAPASELKILDINGEKFILDADADTHITADTDDQIDIAIAGADDFQFTANTFTAQSGSTITTPTLGVGTAKDLGAGLHVRIADSGASVNANEDDLVIEGSADVGMAILGGSSSGASIVFGDSGVGRSGRILYHMGDDYMDFGVNTAGGGATSKLYLSSRGAFVGDVTNGKQGTGMTLNQGANDDEAFALKSSDIGQSVTDVAEADTYFCIKKNSDSSGGALLEGFGENNLTEAGLKLRGYSEGVSGARSSSGTAPVMIDARKNADADGQGIDNESNLCVFQAGGTTRWLLDKEGDSHADGTHNDTVFDDYDDVALLSASRHVTHIDKKFAKSVYGDFIQEHAQVLADNGVITLNDDGHHFVSTKGLNGLIIDAIRQTRNIQKAFYNILSDEQKNKFAGELNEMKLPVLPAFNTP